MWWSEWEGNPKSRRCMYMLTDSSCCTVEINTVLWNNYTPIKINLKRKKSGGKDRCDLIST